MTNDPFNENSEADAVDRALREALRYTPNDVAIDRLERFWREETNRSRRLVVRGFAAAAAAVLLVAAGLAITQPRWGKPVVEVDQPSPQEKNQTQEPAAVPEPLGSAPGVPVLSREPTAFEVVAFYAQTRASRVQFDVGAPALPPTAAQRIAALFAGAGHVSLADWLALQPDSDFYQRLLAREEHQVVARLLVEVASVPAQRDLALDTLVDCPAPPVDALFDLLNDHDPKIRQNAALALGHCNGPEIAERLIAIARDPQERRAETWLALASCRGPAARSFLIEASRQPRLLGYLNAARVRWSLAL